MLGIVLGKLFRFEFQKVEAFTKIKSEEHRVMQPGNCWKQIVTISPPQRVNFNIITREELEIMHSGGFSDPKILRGFSK